LVARAPLGVVLSDSRWLVLRRPGLPPARPGWGRDGGRAHDGREVLLLLRSRGAAREEKTTGARPARLVALGGRPRLRCRAGRSCAGGTRRARVGGTNTSETRGLPPKLSMVRSPPEPCARIWAVVNPPGHARALPARPFSIRGRHTKQRLDLVLSKWRRTGHRTIRSDQVTSPRPNLYSPRDLHNPYRPGFHGPVPATPPGPAGPRAKGQTPGPKARARRGRPGPREGPHSRPRT